MSIRCRAARRAARGSTILQAVLILCLLAGLAAFATRVRQKQASLVEQAAELRAAAWLEATSGCPRQPNSKARLLKRGFERGFPLGPEAFVIRDPPHFEGNQLDPQLARKLGTGIACNELPEASESELHEAEDYFRKQLLPSIH